MNDIILSYLFNYLLQLSVYIARKIIKSCIYDPLCVQLWYVDRYIAYTIECKQPISFNTSAFHTAHLPSIGRRLAMHKNLVVLTNQ